MRAPDTEPEIVVPLVGGVLVAVGGATGAASRPRARREPQLHIADQRVTLLPAMRKRPNLEPVLTRCNGKSCYAGLVLVRLP